jgi:hypothetical protein
VDKPRDISGPTPPFRSFGGPSVRVQQAVALALLLALVGSIAASAALETDWMYLLLITVFYVVIMVVVWALSDIRPKRAISSFVWVTAIYLVAFVGVYLERYRHVNVANIAMPVAAVGSVVGVGARSLLRRRQRPHT